MKTRKSRSFGWLSAAIVAATGLMLLLSPPGQTAAAEDTAATAPVAVTARSLPHTVPAMATAPAAAIPSPTPLATAAAPPPAATSEVDELRRAKDRLLQAAADSDGVDEVVVPTMDGPRPAAADPDEVFDYDEHAIEKFGIDMVVEQKDRMALRLDQRSQRVRARLDEARQDGDEDATRRLEIRLARLDGRVHELGDSSEALRERALHDQIIH